MIQQLKMGIHHPSISISISITLLLLLLNIFNISAANGDSENNCVYTLYVKTGSIIKGGTNSKISVTLSDGSGSSVWIPNLQHWGLMGPGHDYFERGNLDVFAGRGPCIGSPICRLNLTSDGSGSHHGWYCDYIEVTSTGPHRTCSQTTFYVDQWLARDAPPYKLTAVLDGCHLKPSIDDDGGYLRRAGSRAAGQDNKVSHVGARSKSHVIAKSSAM